jgi:hypothetical protein
VLLDSGYTNKEISLIFLDYIILYTNARLNKPLKVLLINQHNSYINPEFIIKATAHNIYLYLFPGYLTHVLQPLNVSVF